MTTMMTDLIAALDYEATTHSEHSKIVRLLSRVSLPPTIRASLYSQWYSGTSPRIALTVEYQYDESGEYRYNFDADSLPWAERVKPIGQVLRSFHARNIKRQVDERGQVEYTADGWIDNEYHERTNIQLSISVPRGGLMPTCRVETETYTETVTRTRVKVTCDDARQEAVA